MSRRSAGRVRRRVRRSPLLARVGGCELGLCSEIVLIAAARAIVQLAAVGALIALVFEYDVLAIAFVAGDGHDRRAHRGGRMQGRPAGARAGDRARSACPPSARPAILIARRRVRAATPRAAIPTAGNPDRRRDDRDDAHRPPPARGPDADADEIEARLSLGDRIRDALAPTVRQAIKTGLVPAIDQTRNVGIVTLPGHVRRPRARRRLARRGGPHPADRPADAARGRAAERDGDRGADRAHPHRPGRAAARRCRRCSTVTSTATPTRLSERLDGFADDPDGLRDAFLQRHVHRLYAELTDDGSDGLRAEELVYDAAGRFPGLAPTRARSSASATARRRTRRASRSRRACSSPTCSPPRAPAAT